MFSHNSNKSTPGILFGCRAPARMFCAFKKNKNKNLHLHLTLGGQKIKEKSKIEQIASGFKQFLEKKSFDFWGGGGSLGIISQRRRTS